MIDNGKISTIVITIVVAILGVVITSPETLQTLLGTELYTKIGIFIIAIAAAIYNYLNPRNTQAPINTTSNTSTMTTNANGILENDDDGA